MGILARPIRYIYHVATGQRICRVPEGTEEMVADSVARGFISAGPSDRVWLQFRPGAVHVSVHVVPGHAPRPGHFGLLS